MKNPNDDSFESLN